MAEGEGWRGRGWGWGLHDPVFLWGGGGEWGGDVDV